jgi:DUF2924 family protein
MSGRAIVRFLAARAPGPLAETVRTSGTNWDAAQLARSFLAYRLLETANGGLIRSTSFELRRIAHALEKGPDSAGPVPPPRIGTETRIVREWQRKTHEVSVTESGLEYGGTNYRSLSQIARKIMGTR